MTITLDIRVSGRHALSEEAARLVGQFTYDSLEDLLLEWHGDMPDDLYREWQDSQPDEQEAVFHQFAELMLGSGLILSLK